MSQARAAFQTLLNTSSALAILLLVVFFFTGVFSGIGDTFRRSHPVELCTNEDASAPVIDHIKDCAESMTILEMIKEKCPSLYGETAVFRPTWWIPGGNFQTMWCVIGELIHRYSIPYERTLLRTADGGTISLDVYPPFDPAIPPEDEDTPTLFILHGLTGSAQEGYIRSTVKEVTRSKVEGKDKGWRVVVMNFRGCDADTPVTTGRLYHAGETDDTRTALLWLTQTYPKAALYGAAYSMGASTIASYLGQEGQNTPLKGVVCVSNPWNWVTAAEYIERGTWINKYLYGPVLADALLRMFKNSRYAFEQDKRISIKDIYSKRYVTIRWFDDRVTAPLFNFRDGWDYYRHASSEPYIEHIRIPHLSIHSRDDPMVAPWNLPYEKVRKSPHVVMATTHGGGHVAWFQTTKEGALTRWFATPVKEFIEAIHSMDPTPRLAPSALPIDAKGFVRSAELPDRVGYKVISGEGLMTARVYNSIAHSTVWAVKGALTIYDITSFRPFSTTL